MASREVKKLQSRFILKTQAEIADAMSVSVNTIAKWLRADPPMPQEDNGTFCLYDVMGWYRNRWLTQLVFELTGKHV